ncbi:MULTISPECIES: hypothetical protein [unclassified Sagittula]|uniref:hypothetical protein n=2 Tax=Sagittula TaxID=58842 RepID=UPI0024C43E15|nr:hypothetical protein [Sagittula sp. MA-2]WHZ33515.1 hypothetical protein QNI11_12735 [Sagittula sp. MA-2]
MTPRWVMWLPLGVLVTCGALLAFRYGWIDANLTESAAIEAYGRRYMREAGAPAADCTGVPGQGVWLVVRCGPEAARWEYRVNRFGGLVEITRPNGMGEGI